MFFVFPRRASFIGALFFCASPLHTVYAADECQANRPLDLHQVKTVYDGDTVKLKNGDKIRFIGINTPEIGKKGKPSDPFARQAKLALEKLLSNANNRIGLLPGKTMKDRYGRLLRHVFLPSGLNVSQQLIQQGLGSQVIITPNTGYIDCYAKAEKQARWHQLGIWSRPNVIPTWKALKLTTGFHHIKGKVTRIGESRRNIWLNFGGDFAIKISRKNLNYFDARHPRELLNKMIETSGWVYTHQRKGRTESRMQVYHPAAIHQL